MKRSFSDERNNFLIQSASCTTIPSLPSSHSQTPASSTSTYLSTITSQKRQKLNNTPNKIGKYIIGKKISGLSIVCISQFLCRKENTNKFFVLKVLNDEYSNNQFDSTSLQGKILLHNEYTLLSLLQNEDGIINQHGLYKEIIKIDNEKEIEKLYLVLDCFVGHEFDNKHQFVNLQHYLNKQKFLTEREALAIFYKIMRILENLHSKNFVHRNLKLSNLVYDLASHKVYIINFCLGRHLIDESERLNDQLGSPAYVSPELLSGESYLGKPNDIWSLGVVFYTMLFGYFPFYNQDPNEMFKKIQSNNYSIPLNFKLSEETRNLIQNIFILDPRKRFNAFQIVESLMSIIADHIWQPLSVDLSDLSDSEDATESALSLSNKEKQFNNQIVPEIKASNETNCLKDDFLDIIMNHNRRAQANSDLIEIRETSNQGNNAGNQHGQNFT